MRPALLFFPLLLIFLAAGISRADEEETQAEEAGEVLELKIETSSSNPFVNSPWSISVLVNHPRPSEVNVKAPIFPASIVLERVRTDTRLIRREDSEDSEAERWTRVEFLFTPLRTGAVSIQPFEAAVGGLRAVSGPTNVRFREETRTVRRYQPGFRWLSQEVSIPLGEKGELLLELSNWDPEIKTPEGFFRGRAPRNAVLEENLPLELKGGVYSYSISVVPLEGESVSLDPFSFNSGDYALTVPGIVVSVTPSGFLAASGLAEQSIAVEKFEEEFAENPAYNAGASYARQEPIIQEEQDSVPPFPPERENVFPLLRGEYNRIAAEVRSYWEEGRRAHALAEIRRNERDSLSGPYLVPLRREMEQALGLGFTEDEKWRPLKIRLLSWAVFGVFLIAAAVFVFVFRPGQRRSLPAVRAREAAFNQKGVQKGVRKNRQKNVTSGRPVGFRAVIAAAILAGLLMIFLEEGLRNFPVGHLKSSFTSAVLEKTPAYRVPDPRGAVNAGFGEGQPVMAGDYTGDWCYAESSDGRSGWVRREAVITY